MNTFQDVVNYLAIKLVALFKSKSLSIVSEIPATLRFFSNHLKYIATNKGTYREHPQQILANYLHIS